MNIKEQFVTVLFDENVHKKALQMFDSNFESNGFKDRLLLDLFDISFRLYKPTSTYVNVEFLASTRIGNYYHPIGFIDKDGSIYIINEFSKEYNKLKSENKIKGIAKQLSTKLNALIAAFSIQTVEYVLRVFDEFSEFGWNEKIENGIMTSPLVRYDKHYDCNGYICDLLFCMEGYPQFFLDDDYGLKGPIGAYIKQEDGGISFHPMVDYKEHFDKLNQFKLLTAFTKK